MRFGHETDNGLHLRADDGLAGGGTILVTRRTQRGGAGRGRGWHGKHEMSPATDQRGLPRVVDIIDIGAYEVQDPFVLPKFTG